MNEFGLIERHNLLPSLDGARSMYPRPTSPITPEKPGLPSGELLHLPDEEASRLIISEGRVAVWEELGGGK